MNPQKIVYGAAKISNLDGKEAYKILSKLYENGIREVDTAPSYGESEKYLGKLIRDFPDLVINSKVGSDSNGNLSPKSIKQSVYNSLQNIQGSSINVLFVHSVPHQQITPEILEVLKELKREGLCNAIGYSGDGDDLSALVLRSIKDIDAWMFTYNILDQSNLQTLNKKSISSQLYVKRVLANGVWRKRTPRDIAKDILGRPRGHDEYRHRLAEMYPEGLEDGHTRSINFVRENFPNAKYLFGISSVRQSEELISYLKGTRMSHSGETSETKCTYDRASEKFNWKPVT